MNVEKAFFEVFIGFCVTCANCNGWNSNYNLSNRTIVLDQYTSPAYFLLVLTGAAIVLLKYAFQDIKFDDIKNNTNDKIKKAKISSSDLESIGADLKNNTTSMSRVERTACCGCMSLVNSAVFGCMLLNVTTKGSIACFETLGIDIAVETFHLTPSAAGDIIATSGLMGVAVLFLYGFLSPFLGDVQVVVGGIATMVVGILSVIALGSTCSNVDGGSHERLFFVTMSLIYAVGYPVGHTAVMGLFSKCKFQCC